MTKLEEERELNAQPFTVKELEALIGSNDYKQFLNTRNELYRERNMKDKPPSRAEAVKLMSENPNLIRRPILINRGKMLFGFDEKAWKEIL